MVSTMESRGLLSLPNLLGVLACVSSHVPGLEYEDESGAMDFSFSAPLFSIPSICQGLGEFAARGFELKLGVRHQ